MEVVIITGMSGAGKSTAMDCLEDQGYYCVDNMPPALISNFIGLAMAQKGQLDKAAFVVDIRGGEFFDELNNAIDDLRDKGLPYKIIYLEASDTALVRRFNETRRIHPMTHASPDQDDFRQERMKLSMIRARSDYIIDTSNMKTSRLKKEIMDVFGGESKEEIFVINIISFGFKNGIPINADMVFDMRFISNPYYIPSLKRSTGNSRKVREYVMKYPESKMFLKNLDKMINGMIPGFMREGKYHVNIAFGCTGGQHRSVTMANEFENLMSTQGKQVTIEHRDIKKK